MADDVSTLVGDASPLSDWEETTSLNVVSLVYDVTPASLVNVLVTERNNLPTSVVPVIIDQVAALSQNY